MTVEFQGQTDVGRQRDENQDAIHCESLDEDTAVVVLADGMGGVAGGATASTIAVETFSDYVASGNWDAEPKSTVRSAVETAQTAVNEEAKTDPKLANMGCTLVGGLVVDDTVVLANVGDSRAYEIGDEAVQLTTDQTVANELVKKGELDPDEVDDHQMSHVLQQSIGSTDDLEPEFVHQQIHGRLLLCSDGLTNELDDRQVANLGEGCPLEDACEELIDAANSEEGSDNISVILVNSDE